MSRLLWVGAGAVGGIYLYRKGEKVWEDAKERGFAGNASILASATSALMSQNRGRSDDDAVGTLTAGQEHVIQLPVKGHQPGMVYEVRAIPAPTPPAKRAGSAVARLASWRATAKRRATDELEGAPDQDGLISDVNLSKQRSSA